MLKITPFLFLRKSAIIIILLVVGNCHAQRKEMNAAKKELKVGNIFKAVRFASLSLSMDSATKRMIKITQEIIAENLDNALILKQSQILEFDKIASNYHRDTSVIYKDSIVYSIKGLMALQERLGNISENKLLATKKRGKNISVPTTDYTPQLKASLSALKEIKIRAANDYLKEARAKSKAVDISELKIAFEYYIKASKLNPSLESELNSEKTSVGNVIGQIMLKEANSMLKKNENVEQIASAYDILRYAKFYSSSDNISFKLKQVKLKLLNTYYSKVSKLLVLDNLSKEQLKAIEKEEYTGHPKDENGNYIVEGLKVSIDPFAKKQETINTKTNKQGFVDSKKLTNKAPNKSKTVSIFSFKNSYKALEYIQKLMEIDPDYKNIKLIKSIAENRTRYVDGRNSETYNTAQFGDKIWMTRNLNYRVPGAEYQLQCINESKTEKKELGYFYNWYTLTKYNKNSNTINTQGLCPKGWRVPNDSDWQSLINVINADNSKLSTFNAQYGSSNTIANPSGDRCTKYMNVRIGFYWSSGFTKETINNTNIFGVNYTTFSGNTKRVSKSNPTFHNSNKSGDVQDGNERANKSFMNCRCVTDLE
ncbi:FISUMP domain-containing protein [Flavivirga jejuensis]|uniref:FISUMP domain-containing protein n=1 Tax=Flavivirga jejuensis TaxID=870487 RepID=A0ABT8WSH0_9FLAO|nr:FISUMP domain-containing protein [Flavivirga jejuensis]MDO5976118.1 FISUMP domain-containing protein [Flavivirga jejuensis]